MEFQWDLSVVLPRYRENRTIVAATLAQLRMLPSSLRVQVLLVDDGGVPGEVEAAVADHPDTVVLRNNKNRGKGYAIKRGVDRAEGRLVFYSDIDLPIDLTAIPEAIDRLAATGKKLLIGRRVRSLTKATSNGNRRLTSTLFRFLFQRLLDPEVGDSQCPFKLIEGSFARRLFSDIIVNGYAFDAEIIHKARLMNEDIVQMDVGWTDTRAPWGVGKTFAVFFRMLFDVCMIRIYWLINRNRLDRRA